MPLRVRMPPGVRMASTTAFLSLLLSACGDEGTGPEDELPPAVTAVDPTVFTTQAAGMDIVISGSAFTSTSKVLWNAHERATVFKSATQLEATLQPGDLAAPGVATVSVRRGERTSSALSVEIRNGVPTLIAMSPDTVLVGTSDLKVRLKGRGFSPNSRGRLNDEDRTTTFLADTLLEIDLSPADVQAIRTARFTVYNPPPGGGLSGTLTVAMSNPVPVIDSIRPARIQIGIDTALTLYGRGFTTSASATWSGYGVAVTRVSSGVLIIRVSGYFLGTAGNIPVTVRNPSPGGGSSNVVTVAAENPAPVLTTMSPDSLESDASGGTIVLTGQKFVSGSTVEMAGTPRTVQFVNATQLRIVLTAADLATPGNHPVVVRNPSPGGGQSSALTLRIVAAPPRLSGLSPAYVTRGGTAFTLTISGRNFKAGNVVRWNGSSRPTTVVTSGTVRAEISAADIASGSQATIVVHDPATGRTSTPLMLPILTASNSVTPVGQVAVTARTIIADPTRNRVYASIGKSAAQHANSVLALDPSSGAIVATLPLAGNPGPMAITDNGQFLYVGLGDASRVVRIDLAAFVRDIDIDINIDSFCGTNTAEDIETLPGLPRAVVVSVQNGGCSPRHAGVYMWDDAVRRTKGTQGHTGSNRITRSSLAGELIGYNNETTEFGTRRIRVQSEGLVEVATYGGLVGSFGVDIVQDGGYIYTTNGRVIDATAMSSIGTFPYTGTAFSPDAARGRLHWVNGNTLYTHHNVELAPLGQALLTYPGSVAQLIRWGSDGLALRTTSHVVFIRTSLAGS